jgi:hypothetical protein
MNPTPRMLAARERRLALQAADGEEAVTRGLNAPHSARPYLSD